MVPHLATALTGPINELEQRLLDGVPAIERWFRLEWMEHTPPLYAGVDLRNAGYKLAPVDTDLFPAEWHNLAPETLPLAVQAAMAAIEKICPEAKKLLLIPQAQIDSAAALANLQQLSRIFHHAGLTVRLGSLDKGMTAPRTLTLPDRSTLVLEPVLRSRGRLGLKHFDPCTVLLNGDMAAGVPAQLLHVHEQFLLPPLHAGGPVRRKSRHFACYAEVAKRFAKLMGLDPWLIAPLFTRCGSLDLSSAAGREQLRGHAEQLLAKIRRKYKSYGITDKPFVVVKADHGMQGRAVLTLRDPSDVDALADAAQRCLRAGTGQHGAAELIIQEGVATHERINDAVAEPVVYLLDRYVVGGFYRAHPERRSDESLDSPGAGFVPLAFEKSLRLPRPGERPGASAPNRFYLYGVLARLALLAASYELEASDPDAEPA